MSYKVWCETDVDISRAKRILSRFNKIYWNDEFKPPVGIYLNDGGYNGYNRHRDVFDEYGDKVVKEVTLDELEIIFASADRDQAYKVWCETVSDVGRVLKAIEDNTDCRNVSYVGAIPVGIYFTKRGYKGCDNREGYDDCDYKELDVYDTELFFDLPDHFETAEGYDDVNRPRHYASDKVECIDAMEEIYGVEAVKFFCLCNMHKYLWRRKDKGSEEQDVQKALWYFDKYKEIVNR